MKKAHTSHKREPFTYEVLLRDRVVWRGTHLQKEYSKLEKKYPHQHISIRWKGREGVLIAKVLDIFRASFQKGKKIILAS